MKKDGIVRIANTGRDSVLSIRAATPIPQAAFRLEFNGEP